MLEEGVGLQTEFWLQQCGLMSKEEHNTLGQAHTRKRGGVVVVPGCPLHNRNFKNRDFLHRMIQYIHYIYVGQDNCQYSDSLQAGRSGDQIPVCAKFSAPVQPPVQWVPGLSQGLSDRGVAYTTHPIQRQGSRKSRAIPLLPLWAFVACYRVTFMHNIYKK
jgi:hypothetical protein